MSPDHSFAACAVFLLVLGLVGCSETDRPAHITRDSAGTRIVESRSPMHGAGPAWRVVPEPAVRIGSVDGAVEQQLTRVQGAARLPDGRIAVADGGTNEIRIFSPAGDWERSMGGSGGGPGEVGWLAWMQLIPPDTILAADGAAPRYAYFLADGTLVGSGRVDPSVGDYPHPVHRLPDGRFLERRDTGPTPVFEGESGYFVNEVMVVAYPPGGGRLDTVAEGPGAERMWFATTRRGRRAISITDVPFGRRSLQAFAGGRVFLGSGASYEIWSGSTTGSPLRIRRRYEARPVTPTDVDRWIETRVAEYPEPRRPEIRRRYAESPAAERIPAYSALIADAVGNLWVEAYRPPWSDADRRWSVFDPAGVWQRDVVMPDGLAILEIGETHVLGLVRDELDVEYVVLHTLTRSRQDG